MRRVGLLLWTAALGLSYWSESVAFAWDDPGSWVPDVVVGLTFIACGLLAWGRWGAQGAETLLAATGVTWFLGNFSADLLYLHRGPLVHLVVAYPGWRPRSRLDLAAVAAAYACALAASLWASEATTLLFAAAIAAVAARGYVTARGLTRRRRLVALQAAALLGAALAGGVVARLAVPSGDAAEPALLGYEAALVGVAIGLYTRLGPPVAAAVADLVVELGESRSGSLRDRLARALGDATLELGWWSAEAGAYVGDAGEPLALPGPGSWRSATIVERDGRPFAVLVHDRAVLGDPALVEAVASATRLSASNAALQSELRAQAAKLTASRRRLLVAADRERRRLEARLSEGPERRLLELARDLAAISPGAGTPSAEHVERARTQLARTLDDVHELARGLHPRELAEGGLPGALAALAERAPVRVELDVRVGRLGAELEAAVYFVCAEALANVAKHASATRARLEVGVTDGRLRATVADDGAGGADPSRGTGLQGLADRVEALGGNLRITSPAGSGTRLAAEIPLDGEAR